MQLVNILGWIGNIGFIVSAYLISKKKISGFYFSLVANSLYTIIGFMTNISSLWAISICLLLMNIYGIINWNIKRRGNYEKETI